MEQTFTLTLLILVLMQTPTNTSSNIVLMLIKNQKTIVSIPSSQGLTIQKRNNDNVLYVSGLPVLGYPSVITQAI